MNNNTLKFNYYFCTCFGTISMFDLHQCNLIVHKINWNFAKLLLLCKLTFCLFLLYEQVYEVPTWGRYFMNIWWGMNAVIRQLAMHSLISTRTWKGTLTNLFIYLSRKHIELHDFRRKSGYWRHHWLHYYYHLVAFTFDRF